MKAQWYLDRAIEKKKFLIFIFLTISMSIFHSFSDYSKYTGVNAPKIVKNENYQQNTFWALSKLQFQKLYAFF